MSTGRRLQLLATRHGFILGGLTLAVMLFAYLSQPMAEIAAKDGYVAHQFNQNCETASFGNTNGLGMDSCSSWTAEPDGTLGFPLGIPTGMEVLAPVNPTVDSIYLGGSIISAHR